MTASAAQVRVAGALAVSAAPIVLTGGGGWLGMATLALLASALGESLEHRVRVFGSRARRLTLPGGGGIDCSPLDALDDYDGPPPLLLHYACLTKDRVPDLGSAAFLVGNAAIRDRVAALVSRRGAAGIFLPSSGAVYGPGRSLAVDAVSNPYGAAKLADEARFAELAVATASPIVTARVFNLAGPYINKPEAYAIAAFLLDLIAGRPVEIRARGRVLRSYLHINDLLLMALGALLLQPSPTPVRFDTEGEVTVEVEELARRAASVLGRPTAEIRRAPSDGRPDDTYVGDGTAMRALASMLGLVPRDLNTQIIDTATFLGDTALHC